MSATFSRHFASYCVGQCTPMYSSAEPWLGRSNSVDFGEFLCLLYLWQYLHKDDVMSTKSSAESEGAHSDLPASLRRGRLAGCHGDCT